MVAPSGTVTFAPASPSISAMSPSRITSVWFFSRRRAGAVDDADVGQRDDRLGVLDEAADGLAELGRLRRNVPGKSDGQDAGRQCAYLHSICSRPAILSQRFDLHGPWHRIRRGGSVMRVACLALVVAFAVSGAVAAQQPFTVGPVTAAPGTMASGTIEIPARTGDQGTTLPIR